MVFAVLGVAMGHPILLLIAVFVFFGARQEAEAATLKEAADETPVARIMQPMPPALRRGMTAIEAAGIAMRDARAAYPLVDADLRLAGMVAAADLAWALESDPAMPVDRIANAGADRLAAGDSVAHALAVARGSAWPFLPVVNAAGQLVGTVARDDLAAFAQPAAAGPAPRASE